MKKEVEKILQKETEKVTHIFCKSSLKKHLQMIWGEIFRTKNSGFQLWKEAYCEFKTYDAGPRNLKRKKRKKLKVEKIIQKETEKGFLGERLFCVENNEKIIREIGKQRRVNA